MTMLSTIWSKRQKHVDCMCACLREKAFSGLKWQKSNMTEVNAEAKITALKATIVNCRSYALFLKSTTAIILAELYPSTSRLIIRSLNSTFFNPILFHILQS